MSDTAIETTDDLAVKYYAEKLWREMPEQMAMSKYIGPETTKKKGKISVTSPNAIIVRKTELVKEDGDKIQVAILMNLEGDGVVNEAQLWGNEEQLEYYSQDVTLNLRRNGVRSRDKMSRKRTRFNFYSSSKDVLKIWGADVKDTDIMLAMSGLANSAGTLDANAPSTNRKLKGGQTSAGVVASDFGSSLTDAEIGDGGGTDYNNYLFGTEIISITKRKADMSSPLITPVATEYGKFFVMWISPLQMKALRRETEWKSAQHEANIRGWKNPIFSGAAGIWDGVVIHVTNKVETRLGAGGSTPSEYFESGDDVTSGVTVARAVFAGAQACILAEGQKPQIETETRDYKRLQGVATELIYQAEKSDFNSEDYGVIVVDTAVVPD